MDTPLPPIQPEPSWWASDSRTQTAITERPAHRGASTLADRWASWGPLTRGAAGLGMFAWLVLLVPNPLWGSLAMVAPGLAGVTGTVIARTLRPVRSRWPHVTAWRRYLAAVAVAGGIYVLAVLLWSDGLDIPGVVIGVVSIGIGAHTLAWGLVDLIAVRVRPDHCRYDLPGTVNGHNWGLGLLVSIGALFGSGLALFALINIAMATSN